MREGAFHDTDTVAYTAQDFRFTTKGSDLYAIELAWPDSNEAVVRSLAPVTGSARIQNVQMLGLNTKLTYEQRADGLHITLPAKPFDQPAYAFRIGFAR